MSYGLMITTIAHLPKRTEEVNLNTDNEWDFTPVSRQVDRFINNVHLDEYSATNSIPYSKNVIYCIPFLAEELKKTAPMKKLVERRLKIGSEREEIKNQWKDRAINTKTKTCYSCKSKIEVLPRNGSSCPNCKAENYLLTQGDRNKLEKLIQKGVALSEQFDILEQQQLKKTLSKKPKLNYLVGGWIHESELPRNY